MDKYALLAFVDSPQEEARAASSDVCAEAEEGENIVVGSHEHFVADEVAALYLSHHVCVVVTVVAPCVLTVLQSNRVQENKEAT